MCCLHLEGLNEWMNEWLNLFMCIQYSMFLWKSSSVTLTPQKSQSACHSAVNMKAVHHEWFWRRRKFIPLLFEHWLHKKTGQTEVISHRHTIASQFMAEHLVCCTLQTQTENQTTIIQSNIHMCTLLTFTKGFRACSYLINMTGFMHVSG